MHASGLCVPDSCLLQSKSHHGAGAEYYRDGEQGHGRRDAELPKKPRGRNLPLPLNQDPSSGDGKIQFLYLASLILGLAAG